MALRGRPSFLMFAAKTGPCWDRNVAGDKLDIWSARMELRRLFYLASCGARSSIWALIYIMQVRADSGSTRPTQPAATTWYACRRIWSQGGRAALFWVNMSSFRNPVSHPPKYGFSLESAQAISQKWRPTIRQFRANAYVGLVILTYALVQNWRIRKSGRRIRRPSRRSLRRSVSFVSALY